MKVKVSEASGIVLDWLTAKAEDSTFSEEYPHLLKSGFETPSYSSAWDIAGPIIEREKLQLTTEKCWGWVSSIPFAVEIGGYRKYIFTYGETPLIAAMRCFVASKLGEEADVPEELLK